LDLSASASPEAAARAYLSTCGSLFGLQDQAHELTVKSETNADRGRSFLHFQQVYRGIPVIGGELVVQIDKDKNIVSVNGEILPGLEMNVIPTISPEAARQRALEKVAKEYALEPQILLASEPELWIYNPAILGGPGPRLSTLVWRLEVYPVELLPIQELVLVEARTGIVVLHFNQIDTALYRRIYDNNNVRSGELQNPANLRRTEGQGPSGLTDVDRAYDYAGDTYNFYWNYHNRDSIDGAGMQMVSTARYCPVSTSLPCPYPNAFWNGAQMVYGEGFVVDDVVAHEMTHGVTDFTSRLFYYYQSGAINESLSDIWGEFVDLTNGKGNDSSSVRWLVGEDIGAIRSMSNPPAYNDPDKMSSSYYHCAESDNGGVHTNSGVGNKAAYLMTDGGSFNGKTVTGIGVEKAAKIFYETQTHLLTSASDYEDLYYALQRACNNLIGTNGITATDCQQVRNALDAVEMNRQPTGCSAPHAPLCDANRIPGHLFFDNLENPSSGKWTSAATIGTNRWYYPQNSHPYDFDATYATSGVYNIWGYDQSARADYSIQMTLDVALPTGSTPYMHFNHAYGFEDNTAGTTFYDGGVVEYSTNGGVSWNDAGSLFSNNGYNGTLYSGNPLNGRQAFGGESNGYISSRLNLSSLAGQNVRFRFRIGTDNSYADYGWFIDDVRIYTCAETLRVHLPLALRDYVPPTPGTPTPTPTPGGPMPTPTPMPTSTSAPVIPLDGNWIGTTNLGKIVTFQVTNSGTRWNTFAVQCPNGVFYVTLSSGSITNGTMQYGYDGVVGFTGQFNSSTTAVGTYQASACGPGTWTASYVPPTPTLTPTPISTPTHTPTPTPTSGGPTPTPNPSGWEILVNTDFEGDFPSPWNVYDDDGSTNGEYYWGKRNCRTYAGNYSGWAVGAGANGAALSCGSNYPNDANSSMDYGPFSLVGASAADLTFKLWLNTESGYDYVCRGASINGTDFYGYCTSGNSSGWIDRVLDLTNVPTLGNLLGQPQVWVNLWFYSDSSVTYAEGGYVDNVMLRRCPQGTTCPTGGLSALPADSQIIEFPWHIRQPR